MQLKLSKQRVLDPVPHRWSKQRVVIKMGLSMQPHQFVKNGGSQSNPKPGGSGDTGDGRELLLKAKLFECTQDPNRQGTARPGGGDSEGCGLSSKHRANGRDKLADMGSDTRNSQVVPLHGGSDTVGEQLQSESVSACDRVHFVPQLQPIGSHWGSSYASV